MQLRDSVGVWWFAGSSNYVVASLEWTPHDKDALSWTYNVLNQEHLGTQIHDGAHNLEHIGSNILHLHLVKIS
jgi:hypothetical protein